MPLDLKLIGTMTPLELETAVAALEPSELENTRRALNDHIKGFNGVDDENLELNFLSALARVCGRCRAKNAGPPKVAKAPRSATPKSASLGSLLDNLTT